MRSAAILLRWLVTIPSVVVAMAQADSDRATHLAALALVIGVAAWRTMSPERQATRSAVVRTVIECGALLAALGLTGAWSSPYVYVPAASVLASGLTFGWIAVALAAAAFTVGTTAAALITTGTFDEWTLAAQVAVIDVLAGACGAVAYRAGKERDRRFAPTRDDQIRLAAANDLLTALHGVAATLSAPLDLVEVLAAARDRVGHFGADHITLVLAETSGEGWRTEFTDGVHIPATHAVHDIPPLFAAALSSHEPVVVPDFAAGKSNGWSPVSRSGMAIALRVRSEILGVLTVEYDHVDAMTHDDVTWLGGLAANLALSIDNAQWFVRIRSLGAEAERARIARDLHDRLAQSLAYVALELERIDRTRGETELARVIEVVRDSIAELRTTLYELRTTPTEERSLTAVLREYTDRFTARTGIAVTLRTQDEDLRFAQPIEVELWRILQESLTNVERHAQATRAWVTVSNGGDRAIVEVRDNGKGFRPAVVATDHYGIVGMRERADAINAHLTIDSEPGAGTCVRLEVEAPQ